jgi:hypothetical protein
MPRGQRSRGCARPRSVPEVILKNQPADYTETLGAIAIKLEIVGHFMAAIEQHPGDPHDAGALHPSHCCPR